MKNGLRISCWAPPTDNNDTKAYISYVCKNMRISADTPIDFCSWYQFSGLFFNMAITILNALASQLAS